MRAAALLLATAAVVLVFAALALVNPVLGGRTHAGTAWVGAGIFVIVLVLAWLRVRKGSIQHRAAAAAPAATGPKTAALVVIAVVLWLMAGLFWYFTAVGIDLQFGVDPLLFSVPLTIYPFLILGVRSLPQASTPVKDR